MGDAAAHLAGADHADGPDLAHHARPRSLMAAGPTRCMSAPERVRAGSRPRPAFPAPLEFRQDREEVAHEAVVGHLEDRRLLVLVDRDDDLRVLHAGEVLDGARDADRDVEVGRHDLAGLAHLPVVGRVARVHRGARGAHGGAELVGDGLEVGLEVLGLAHGAAARHDDLGGGELRPIRLGQLLALEARQRRVRRRRPAPRSAPRPPPSGRRREGGRPHRHDLHGVGRLHGLDGVAGVDRALERVGRHHLVISDTCITSSSAARRGMMFLVAAVARRHDGPVVVGERHQQRRDAARPARGRGCRPRRHAPCRRRRASPPPRAASAAPWPSTSTWTCVAHLLARRSGRAPSRR